MKNQDHSFAFLAVIILAGIIVACLPDAPSGQDKTETASIADSGSSSSSHSGISAKF